MASTVTTKDRLSHISGDRRFALLVDAIEDYAIYMIDPDGIIATWNRGAERMKGYGADEIIGQHFSCFYTAEERDQGEPLRALRLARETGAYKIEAWRLRKGGERFWADVLLDPIIDEAGAILGYAKVTRDLTERLAAQTAIASAREAVAQAQRMDAVGRLTGGVAHDFNNLLTVIRGNVDLLQGHVGNESPQAVYCAAIADAAKRASSLTAQLLAFARRQALKPVALDCRVTVEALMDMSQSLVGPNIAITLSVPVVSCPVMVDPGQLDTAIINLIVNARDAITGRGEVRISVKHVPHPMEERGNVGGGGHITITVEDTGSGIPPDDIPLIFEPFFTTKSGVFGTGLGLSQVFGFISQSGGDVTVESTIGTGTAIRLWLPLTHEPLEAPVPHVSEPEAYRNTERVLVVEDNAAVGKLTIEVIGEMGCAAVLVGDGHAALEELRTTRLPYDFVFSDIVLPGMTGLELGAEVQRLYPDTRVALTSGYSDALVEEGPTAFAFIQKPYTAAQLVLFIHEFLDHARSDGDTSTGTPPALP